MPDLISSTSILNTEPPRKDALEFEGTTERVPNASLEQRRSTQTNIANIIVAKDGSGDFYRIEDAVDYVKGQGLLGAANIFVRSGTYTPARNIIYADNIFIEGENKENTIIDLAGTYGILARGTDTGGGSVSATEGSAAVTGAGTTFTTSAAGNWILIQGRWYEIASITDNTNLTLVETFQESNISGYASEIMLFREDVGLRNLTILAPVNNFTVDGLNDNGITFKYCKNVTTENVRVEEAEAISIAYITIENLRARNMESARSTGTGFQFQVLSNPEIDNIKALDGAGIGINILATVGGNISNLTVRGNATRGIFIQTGSTDNNFSNLESHYNDGVGLEIANDSHRNSIVNYVSVDNASDGGYILGNDNKIIGGIANGNDGDGVDIRGSRNTVNAVSLLSNAGYGVNIGDAAADANLIIGNQFSGNVTGTVNDVGTNTVIVGNQPSSGITGAFVGGSASRATAAGTGTQTITGVGFKPRLVIIRAARGLSSNASCSSTGWATAASVAGTGVLVELNDYGAAPVNIQYPSANAVIRMELPIGTIITTASMDSMDIDGFTLNFAIHSNPAGAGILYFEYICFA